MGNDERSSDVPFSVERERVVFLLMVLACMMAGALVLMSVAQSTGGGP